MDLGLETQSLVEVLGLQSKLPKAEYLASALLMSTCPLTGDFNQKSSLWCITAKGHHHQFSEGALPTCSQPVDTPDQSSKTLREGEDTEAREAS